jgi:two-component system, response regulator RegA
LFVDDDPTQLTMWSRVAGRDRRVLTATDAATALSLARDEAPDLAVVDMRLGEASGIDLVAELRRTLTTAKIVLCSGYLSVETAIAAVRAGADDVLFKPCTIGEILQRLDDDTGSHEPELDRPPTLARIEWEHIARVLADCDGNISAAARRLGIYRSTLQRKLRRTCPPEHGPPDEE